MQKNKIIQNVQLIVATPENAATIKTLADEIWNAHYLGIISQQQIDYMLANRYSPEKIKSEISAGINYYLILLQEILIGFISIEKNPDSTHFLHKFYLKKQSSGLGIGSEVFLQLIEKHTISTIRLQVNRKNYQTVNFYFKLGFKIEKAEDFAIGGGYFMEDFVMVWQQEKLV